MPIKHFEELDWHDPTSPECLVAENEIELLVLQQKLERLKVLAYIVGITALIVFIISAVVTTTAICNWVVAHHENYIVFTQYK